MHIYLIAYEISDYLLEYSELKETIRGLSPDVQHPMECVWFVKSGDSLDFRKTAERLNGCLKSTNDKIYMMEIPSEETTHSGWLPKVMWKWFRAEVKK